MRARVRFSKFGSMKFLGHLDVMRYFQKAIRRSGLNVSYSEGYSPHQIMSFAQPLSLMVTSDGEYFDVEFNEEYSEEEILTRLQNCMSVEFAVTKVTRRDDYVPQTKKETAMSLIRAAAYYVELNPKKGYSIEHIRKLSEKKEFPILKKAKTTEREIDLMPGIRELYLYENGSITLLRRREDITKEIIDTISVDNGLLHAEPDTAKPSLMVVLEAGSDNNISVNLICKALSEISGIEYDALDFRIHRMELYGDTNGEVHPLWQIRL